MKVCASSAGRERRKEGRECFSNQLRTYWRKRKNEPGRSTYEEKGERKREEAPLFFYFGRREGRDPTERKGRKEKRRSGASLARLEDGKKGKESLYDYSTRRERKGGYNAIFASLEDVEKWVLFLNKLLARREEVEEGKRKEKNRCLSIT